MVQNSRSIDDLPLSVFVFAVAYKQVLGCKRVGLHIDISVCHVVDERGFADVRETRHNERARVGVDLRKTRQMFPHFFEVS